MNENIKNAFEFLWIICNQTFQTTNREEEKNENKINGDCYENEKSAVHVIQTQISLFSRKYKLKEEKMKNTK